MNKINVKLRSNIPAEAMWFEAVKIENFSRKKNLPQ